MKHEIVRNETVTRIEATLKKPVVNLDGDAYVGMYELNNAESIKKYIKRNLRDRVYVNDATGKGIIISGNSAGKLAAYHSEGELHQRTIAHIPKIIKNMLPLGDIAAEKTGAKHDTYSYYITPINLTLESGTFEICTVFSTVGYSGNNVYYDQTVFKGMPSDVYNSAKIAPDAKTQRLADLLKAVEGSD